MKMVKKGQRANKRIKIQIRTTSLANMAHKQLNASIII